MPCIFGETTKFGAFFLGMTDKDCNASTGGCCHLHILAHSSWMCIPWSLARGLKFQEEGTLDWLDWAALKKGEEGSGLWLGGLENFYFSKSSSFVPLPRPFWRFFCVHNSMYRAFQWLLSRDSRPNLGFCSFAKRIRWSSTGFRLVVDRGTFHNFQKISTIEEITISSSDYLRFFLTAWTIKLHLKPSGLNQYVYTDLVWNIFQSCLPLKVVSNTPL